MRQVKLHAESKVAPLKPVTIPRLELLGALMLEEQVKAVTEACELQKCDVTLWSDSTITLTWIKKEPHEQKAFVGNRVETIKKLTKQYQWKHVRLADNPADLVSRGMQIKDFLQSKPWLEGPSWLKCGENKWPISKVIISPEASNEITKECKPRKSNAKVFKISSANTTV